MMNINNEDDSRSKRALLSTNHDGKPNPAVDVPKHAVWSVAFYYCLIQKD
jgi:hypothetical protein